MNMKLIKNIIRIITLVPLSLYFIYCSYFVITNFNENTYIDCGTVISRSSDEINIKHGTKTELYLNVQFEKSGFRSIECTPTTYFSKKKGDDVCFKLNKDTNGWQMFNELVGFIVLFVLVILILVGFIYYILPDSWK